MGADEKVAGVLDEAEVVNILSGADQIDGAAIEIDIQEGKCGCGELDNRGLKGAADDANGKAEGIGIGGNENHQQSQRADEQEETQQEDSRAAVGWTRDADAVGEWLDDEADAGGKI